MNENNADLTALTRGNGVDQGWINTEDGFWTPSLWDRRRLGVATATMIAEVNELEYIAPPLIVHGMKLNAAEDEGDLEALMENFHRWAKKNV